MMKELTTEEAAFVMYNDGYCEIGGYDALDGCGMIGIFEKVLSILNKDGYVLVKKESGE